METKGAYSIWKKKLTDDWQTKGQTDGHMTNDSASDNIRWVCKQQS